MYFGARIISLNKVQQKELKQLYKEPILVKLNLSKKMPKKILYIQRAALGIGLITPKTAVAIATLRFYFRNICSESNVADMITLNKEFTAIESGLNNIKYMKDIVKYWIEIQVDNVDRELQKHQLELNDNNLKLPF